MLGPGHVLVRFPHAGSGVLGVIRSLMDFENFMRKSNTSQCFLFKIFYISKLTRKRFGLGLYLSDYFCAIDPKQTNYEVRIYCVRIMKQETVVNSFWEWVWDQVVQYILCGEKVIMELFVFDVGYLIAPLLVYSTVLFLMQTGHL